MSWLVHCKLHVIGRLPPRGSLLRMLVVDVKEAQLYARHNPAFTTAAVWAWRLSRWLSPSDGGVNRASWIDHAIMRTVFCTGRNHSVTPRSCVDGRLVKFAAWPCLPIEAASRLTRNFMSKRSVDPSAGACSTPLRCACIRRHFCSHDASNVYRLNRAEPKRRKNKALGITRFVYKLGWRRVDAGCFRVSGSRKERARGTKESCEIPSISPSISRQSIVCLPFPLHLHSQPKLDVSASI